MGSATETKFVEYFEKWKKELEQDSNVFGSNTTNLRNTHDYKNMIKLGKQALPYLIQKLREGYFLLNDAVSDITKIDIRELMQTSTYYSEQEISALWIDWWEKNQGQKNVSTSIAPWALPKEPIPLYVFVNKTMPVLKCDIRIPEYYDVVDTINILDVSHTGNIVTVNRIGHTMHTEKDYFGIVIASNKVFDSLAVKDPIKITLFDENGKIENTSVYAKIFRPLLTINQIPSEISLNNQYETILPIHLKYEGFGDLSLRIEGTVDGNIVTAGGRSVIDTIVYGLMKEGIVDDELKEKTQSGIIVNKEKLLSLLDEFKDNLRSEEFVMSLENDKEISREAIDWIKRFDQVEQEKFMDVLYNTVETYLIKKITDTISKNVSNKTYLDSGTEISTLIKTQIVNLHLKIFYKDRNGNIYTPLETDVKIMDKRKNNSPVNVTIPIEIEKVDETAAYNNVREMPIGISS